MPARSDSKPSANGSDKSAKKAKKNRKKENRLVKEGDRSPSLTESGVEEYEVVQSVESAQQSKITAVKDIIEKTPPHDINTILGRLVTAGHLHHGTRRNSAH